MVEQQAGDDWVDAVRGGDYDRFLAIQCAPRQLRGTLYAVTALSIELARIAETVSEPLIGHIKLAWWREALEQVAQGQQPRPHPLFLALMEIHATHPAVMPHLLAMVEARAADLDSSRIADETAWLAYCDGTAGSLHGAWALLLGADPSQMPRVAAEARAYAMIGLVRAIPFMASQDWLRFPHARLSASGVESLAPSAALTRFCADMVGEAQRMLETTETAILPKPLNALKVLSTTHARALARAGFDPYRAHSPKLALVWCVTRMNIM